MFRDVPGCSGMFRVTGFIDAQIWAKVPHENRHFKIPYVYFCYIKERLFIVKGGLIFVQFCKTTRKIQRK